MRLALYTAPTAEVVSVAEVKDHPNLRITDNDHDLYIARMIVSARRRYEEFTGNILMLSTWDLYLDCFPDGSYIELPVPLTSATVTYINAAGTSVEWAAANYVLDIYSPIAARLSLAYGKSWPSTYAQINAVKVRFIAGYAKPAAVPDDIKDGMYLLIEQIYDGVDRQKAWEALWWPYRRIPV